MATINRISETITSGQAKIIIDLLTEIKEVLEEIRDDNRETDKDEETYTCDNCNEEQTGEPYKSINRYTFCSNECFDKWSDSEN